MSIAPASNVLTGEAISTFNHQCLGRLIQLVTGTEEGAMEHVLAPVIANVIGKITTEHRIKNIPFTLSTIEKMCTKLQTECLETVNDPSLDEDVRARSAKEVRQVLSVCESQFKDAYAVALRAKNPARPEGGRGDRSSGWSLG